jgi:signal transduction histidine kinase
VHLADAVADAAEDAGLAHHGVRLVSKVGARARVLADPEQLNRILVNLLRNAREAIVAKPGGDGHGRIDITFERREASSLVRIADNGPGVPERVRERLFQPFSGTTRQGGAGLGLAISRELAQGHGGDLVLASTGPEGTVFELTLPNAAKT